MLVLATTRLLNLHFKIHDSRRQYSKTKTQSQNIFHYVGEIVSRKLVRTAMVVGCRKVCPTVLLALVLFPLGSGQRDSCLVLHLSVNGFLSSQQGRGQEQEEKSQDTAVPMPQPVESLSHDFKPSSSKEPALQALAHFFPSCPCHPHKGGWLLGDACYCEWHIMNLPH